MVLDSQRQSLLEEVRRHYDASTRRNDEASRGLRAADKVDDWDRVLDCHQRKMRSHAQQNLLLGVQRLVESLSIGEVILELEHQIPRSRSTVLSTVRIANAKAAAGQLAHEQEPPQFDQDWSNVSFALGQDLMLTHILNFARYAAQMPSDVSATRAPTEQKRAEWALAQATFVDEVDHIRGVVDSLKEQQEHWRTERRSAIKNGDERLTDRAVDSLNNLEGQRASVAEILRIADRSGLDSGAERRSVVIDLDEFQAFAQARQGAWNDIFGELIAARDVSRAESANGFLNQANGYLGQAGWASSVASPLRATLE